MARMDEIPFCNSGQFSALLYSSCSTCSIDCIMKIEKDDDNTITIALSIIIIPVLVYFYDKMVTENV